MRLTVIVEDPGSGLDSDGIPTPKVLIAALAHLMSEIGQLDPEIAHRAKENEAAKRLMTAPFLGRANMPCKAIKHWTTDRHGHCGPRFAPPETFQKARDFAASSV